MTIYLESIFKVLYQTQPGTQERLGATVQELAFALTEKCFSEATLHDKKGHLSVESFVDWYSNSGSHFLDDQESTSESGSTPTLNSQDSRHSMGHLLGLDVFKVHEVFDIFAEESIDGELPFIPFRKCFEKIIALGGGYISEEEQVASHDLVRRLFTLFDVNDNEAVDYTGISYNINLYSMFYSCL